MTEFALHQPYPIIGTFVVWLALFAGYYVHERRSNREGELFCATVLSILTVIVAFMIVGLIVAVSWLTQIGVAVLG